MDPRGYSPPICPGYSSYPRLSSIETELAPRNRSERDRHYSTGDLSLSDDQSIGDMHYWTASKSFSNKQDLKGSSNPRLEIKHQELKKPLVTTRNQNPGVDVALRSLAHEINLSLKMFQAFVQCFDAEVETLRNWAEDYTLDTVWRNKVRDECRAKRHREKFEGVAGRILDARGAVKAAVKNAKALREVWDDRYEIERQIRTAKKTLLYCQGIIDLAERAAHERLACKQLVSELEEAKCLLDQKKHPWICKRASIEHLFEVAKDDMHNTETVGQMAKAWWSDWPTISSSRSASERRPRP